MGQIHDVGGGPIGVGIFIVIENLFVPFRYEDVVIHNGFFISFCFILRSSGKWIHRYSCIEQLDFLSRCRRQWLAHVYHFNAHP